LIAERTLHAGYLEGVDVSGIVTGRGIGVFSFLHSVALTRAIRNWLHADYHVSGFYQNVGSHIAMRWASWPGIRTKKMIATYAERVSPNG